jgi:hypothetical protein
MNVEAVRIILPVALLAATQAAGAQSRLAEPPRPPLVEVPVASAPAPTGPRQTLQLPEAERAAIDRAETAKEKKPEQEPFTIEAPPPGEQIAARETRIEQVVKGNPVVEVIVTPAGFNHSYTMINREGQRPLNIGGDRSNLSTPQFFKFEF